MFLFIRCKDYLFFSQNTLCPSFTLVCFWNYSVCTWTCTTTGAAAVAAIVVLLSHLPRKFRVKINFLMRVKCDGPRDGCLVFIHTDTIRCAMPCVCVRVMRTLHWKHSFKCIVYIVKVIKAIPPWPSLVFLLTFAFSLIRSLPCAMRIVWVSVLFFLAFLLLLFLLL